MLAKFEVENFKSFHEKTVFNLSETKNYGFNTEYIKNNISVKNLVYGINGSGKSNLGLAIFDIVRLTTTKNFPNTLYAKNYICALAPNKPVKFSYTFNFDGNILEYIYSKRDYETLTHEEVIINGKTVIKADRVGKNISIQLKGTENLNRQLESNKVSVVAYLRTHANLDKRNRENKVFAKFLDFIDHMLYFRSLESNEYIGLTNGSNLITSGIVERGKVKDLENFLNKVGIKCKLESKDDEIFFCFGERQIPIFEIASRGTETLLLFYFWLLRVQDKKEGVSLLFIDEFDAFYHYELAEFIVETLKKTDVQLILTTHDTNLISNELLRPDCYFIIQDNCSIKNLSQLTERELRQAHNLEKLYKANAFALSEQCGG